jgi:hypothetical protein
VHCSIRPVNTLLCPVLGILPVPSYYQPLLKNNQLFIIHLFTKREGQALYGWSCIFDPHILF